MAVTTFCTVVYYYHREFSESKYVHCSTYLVLQLPLYPHAQSMHYQVYNIKARLVPNNQYFIQVIYDAPIFHKSLEWSNCKCMIVFFSPTRSQNARFSLRTGTPACPAPLSYVAGWHTTVVKFALVPSLSS